MPVADINGVHIAYEVIGDHGRPWIITPGGRFSKDYGGVREFAEAIAAHGNRVVIWDRPNCGESDVCFEGESESDMQADALVGLLRHLDMAPAVIIGGSGGARVSLLAAARHPDACQALACWWISGGYLGLMALANYYCFPSLGAAWKYDMEAVADLPDWQEVISRNPRNRDIILRQDRRTFMDTLERWSAVYYPRADQKVPGLSDDLAARLTMPTLVFRSGESDLHHTRATSEALAAGLPNARLVDPPWGDREWIERGEQREVDGSSIFCRWHLLTPQLIDWSNEVLGS